MLTKENKIGVILVFILQILLLIGMVAQVKYVLTKGQEVTVKMQGYDPYDALRGRYLLLSLSNTDVQYKGNVERYEKSANKSGSYIVPNLYLILEKDNTTPKDIDNLYFTSHVTLDKPTEDTPYIKCSGSAYIQDDNKVRVFTKGLSKYYVNEKEAKDLEKLTQNPDIDTYLTLRILGDFSYIDYITVDGVKY